MAEVLPNDFFLRKHNTELYVQEKMHEKLPFLNMFPMVDNPYGEFTSLIYDLSAKKEMEKGKQGVPVPHTEGVEFSEIDFEDVEEKAGTMRARGFMFKWSNKLIRQGKLTAELQIKVSRTVSNLSIFYNDVFSKSFISAAGLNYTGFNLGDFRVDAGEVQGKFDDDGHGFALTDVYLNAVDFRALKNYLVSFDNKFPFTEISVRQDEISMDGVLYHNLQDSIEEGKFLGFDRTVPAAIIEKYVDPQFSVLQAKIDSIKDNDTISASKKQKQLSLIPTPLVNVLKEDKLPNQPTMNQMSVWAELGVNVREPRSIITGTVVKPPTREE